MVSGIQMPSLVSRSANSGAKEVYTNPKTRQQTDKSTAFQGYEELKQQRYNDIFKHEEAHLKAAGSLARSGIVIEKDSNGVATKGHVDIATQQAVNKANPKDTYEKAKIARDAALAPESFSELSDADKNVAAQSARMMAQAQAEMGQNKSTNGSSDGKVGTKFNYVA